MEYALSASNITKTYNGRAVLNELSINIARGDIYGLLGQNGSGKTTFLRIIAGLIRDHGGAFQVFGKSISDENCLKKVSFLIEAPCLYDNLNAFQNLKLICDLREQQYNIIDGLLLDAGLNEYKKVKIKNYSLGMKQRLAMAMALVGAPGFLVLDEPMNGLDPTGVYELRELILRLNRQGVTVLITSHILSELSQLANRYGIIHNGQIISEFDINSLNESNQTLEERYMLLIRNKV